MKRDENVTVSVTPEIAKMLEHWGINKPHKCDLMMYVEMLRNIQDKCVIEMDDQYPNLSPKTFTLMSTCQRLRQDLEVFLKSEEE